MVSAFRQLEKTPGGVGANLQLGFECMLLVGPW